VPKTNLRRRYAIVFYSLLGFISGGMAWGRRPSVAVIVSR
jgi:hypothetical protein